MDLPLRTQHTILRPVAVQGLGYWTGHEVCVEFRPSGPHTGVVFVRRDQPGMPRIAAHVHNRAEIPRRTSLVTAASRVDMVEHVLAALSGLQIDNCEVWVDRAEMPGCDGSSLPFVNALQRAGRVPQEAHRPALVVTRTLRVCEGDAWIEARPHALPATLITYLLDYGHCPAIGQQTMTVQLAPQTFIEQLAPARTFLLESEAMQLRQQGLGRRVTYGDLLVFGPQGPLENTLRFADECVRHKALDVVGDLALAPYDLIGSFVACRSGHRLNAQLVAALLDEGHVVQAQRRAG